MQSFSLKKSIQFVKDNRSRMFWLWITYQAIKGSLTLTFIWIPLFLIWKNSGGFKTFLPDWGGFLAANLAFIFSHFILLNQRVRKPAESLLGRQLFLVVFSMISLGLYGLCVVMALKAPQDVVWQYQIWHGYVAIVLIALGIGLVGFGIGARNPFSVFSRSGSYDYDHPGICRVTRHPVLWGIALWSMGHVIANGHVGVLAFFVLQAIFSVIGVITLDKRRKAGFGTEEVWREASKNTSLFPNPLGLLTALQKDPEFATYAIKRTSLTLIAVVTLLLIHPVLFAVSPLAAIGVSLP